MNSGVTDEDRGANRLPGKLNVKTGPPVSLYFGFSIFWFSLGCQIFSVFWTIFRNLGFKCSHPHPD